MKLQKEKQKKYLQRMSSYQAKTKFGFMYITMCTRSEGVEYEFKGHWDCVLLILKLPY